ncbi:MAG TPA: hypothetical protein IGS53_02495 [Leptolyngbyaceae cyanobacterium M33_DOE_097]|uniref:Metallopeptidase n=1 Tax=Oscillatoriales cyanobacterium SpSt-418 TaxID=2282169 RepID=A0A7C3PMF3_9CYAN|nr:hypothetical protein [Leptolyngbyaceae cyanobacterium M33_DOE_097]
MTFRPLGDRPLLSVASLKRLLTSFSLVGLLSGCIVVEEPPTSSAPTAPSGQTTQPAPSPGNAARTLPAQTPQAIKGTGRMKVVYYPVKNPMSQAMKDIYQKTQIFERMSALIDSDIKLPRQVTVELAECGFENAFYEPAKHRIVVCYELTRYFINLYRKLGLSDREAGEKAMFATVFTFFHEAGHMLTNELELPITGREEDAADQFSTIILAERAGEAGEKAAEAAALWFGAADSPATRTRFMDEHSLDQQRFYAIMCLLYGNNPQKYGRTATQLGFQETRKAKCQREYAQVSRSWKALLAPHVRNSRS